MQKNDEGNFFEPYFTLPYEESIADEDTPGLEVSSVCMLLCALVQGPQYCL